MDDNLSIFDRAADRLGGERSGLNLAAWSGTVHRVGQVPRFAFSPVEHGDARGACRGQRKRGRPSAAARPDHDAGATRHRHPTVRGQGVHHSRGICVESHQPAAGHAHGVDGRNLTCQTVQFIEQSHGGFFVRDGDVDPHHP